MRARRKESAALSDDFLPRAAAPATAARPVPSRAKKPPPKPRARRPPPRATRTSTPARSRRKSSTPGTSPLLKEIYLGHWIKRPGLINRAIRLHDWAWNPDPDKQQIRAVHAVTRAAINTGLMDLTGHRELPQDLAPHRHRGPAREIRPPLRVPRLRPRPAE